jgi:hypothetical protein
MALLRGNRGRKDAQREGEERVTLRISLLEPDVIHNPQSSMPHILFSIDHDNPLSPSSLILVTCMEPTLVKRAIIPR